MLEVLATDDVQRQHDTNHEEAEEVEEWEKTREVVVGRLGVVGMCRLTCAQRGVGERSVGG